MLRYEGIVPGRFCQRVNRFTAWVELAEGRTLCHVKNTGRCAELLRPGAPVWCQHSDAPGRKTAYTLITVTRDGAHFNLDSTAPNVLAAQWLASGGAGFLPEQLQREVSWEDSRFDLAFQRAGKPCLLEVKGVTLEEDGIARFPDAPTERGVKHLHELAQAQQAGYRCAVAFVIQMEGITEVRPNVSTQPEFGTALAEAKAAGVQVLFLLCHVGRDSLEIVEQREG